MEEKQDGGKWGSDEIVLDDFSCNQLSRMATSFLEVFRLALSSKEGDDSESHCVSVARVMRDVLNAQIALNEAKVENPSHDANEIGLMALCLAGLACGSKGDPRSLTMFMGNIIQAASELTKKTGPLAEDDVIIVEVRKPESQSFDLPPGTLNIQIGLRVESSKTIEQLQKEALNSEGFKKLTKIISRSIHREDEKEK